MTEKAPRVEDIWSTMRWTGQIMDAAENLNRMIAAGREQGVLTFAVPVQAGPEASEGVTGLKINIALACGQTKPA